MTNEMNNMGPLSGIKVVDLTAMVSGPSATMYLADQGADVIKIEPLEGELMRKVGTHYNGMTNSFLCCNRSKRSLTLNLKDEKGFMEVFEIQGLPTMFVIDKNFKIKIFDY